MSRDIQDRLRMFWSDAHVDRIALNMDQIEELNPPPSPAKITDSRATSYIERFGDDSWELDALSPAVLDALVEEAISSRVDMTLWDGREAQENSDRAALTALSDNWPAVESFLDREGLIDNGTDEDEE
jgi:hypothetical protein